MLKSHMDASEAHLLEIAKIPAGSGHNLHKGTPREAFIREFLESHLAETVAIGSGEVIDASSRPAQSRNQLDIVVFRKNYPKLSFGGGVSGFLVESVVSTIEVKSTLTKPDFKTAVAAAHRLKRLRPNVVTSFHAGWKPPNMLSFLVAYDGPATMETIYGWVGPVHEELGIAIPSLPTDENQRIQTVGPSLDGIFVLGRGFLHFDNLPVGFVSDQRRAQLPGRRWVWADTERGSLLLLFLLLTQAVGGTRAEWLNPIPYLSRWSIGSINYSP